MKPMGELTGELEIILEQMVDEHDLQHGEVLALVHMWLMVHRPGARECYVEGGHPTFYYGPEEK